jgi:hypothetical protein
LLASFPVPRLVKIDVEGAELKVLRGLEGLLLKADPPHVLCEVTMSYLEQLGDTTNELYSWMEGLGFRAHLFDGYRLRALPKGARQKRDQETILFAKEGLVA